MLKEVVMKTYKETLDRVEMFMNDSGIRDFCSKICRGMCCMNCYESENACHKNEGRRLACSLFICDSLKYILFSKKERFIPKLYKI